MVINMVTPEGHFLDVLFKLLNASNVRYAVMRNYESLPYSAGGSDLDILVAHQDGERTKMILHNAIRSANGVSLGISETLGFFKVYAYGQNSGANCTWWGQCIDVNIGLFFKGMSQLKEDEPLPIQIYREINVLAVGIAGVLGVLKEVLNNGTYPDRYASTARLGVTLDWEAIKKLLAPMGDVALEHLKALILNDVPSQEKSTACYQFRKTLLNHAMIFHASQYFIGRVIYERNKVRRYFKPSGIVIAILGVDGAGKSTIINAIKPVLDYATHNATVIQHLRPGLLPPLARLKDKEAVLIGPVLDPHGSKPSSAIGSVFRLIYLMMDYTFGYWLKTRLKIAKHPTVVIFDRYAYDMVIDPRRFRIALPAVITRWFTRLAPKPDLIFCLYGNPPVIAARKCELPLAEVTRQVIALKEFAAIEPRAVLISTESTVDQARDQVLEAISKYCIERTGRSSHFG